MGKAESKSWIIFLVAVTLLFIVIVYEFIVEKTFSLGSIGILLLLLPSGIKKFVSFEQFKKSEKICLILAIITFIIAIYFRFTANVPL